MAAVNVVMREHALAAGYRTVFFGRAVRESSAPDHGRPWAATADLQWSGFRPVVKVVSMDTIPITEAKARIAELADRVAREHDHFTITRNGRADVMLISVAEYRSLLETLEILSDDETLADLRASREDFAVGDTFAAAGVRAELERRRDQAT